MVVALNNLYLIFYTGYVHWFIASFGYCFLFSYNNNMFLVISLKGDSKGELIALFSKSERERVTKIAIAKMVEQ